MDSGLFISLMNLVLAHLCLMFANAVDSNVMLRLSVKYVACYKKENG